MMPVKQKRLVDRLRAIEGVQPGFVRGAPVPTQPVVGREVGRLKMARAGVGAPRFQADPALQPAMREAPQVVDPAMAQEVGRLPGLIQPPMASYRRKPVWGIRNRW